MAEYMCEEQIKGLDEKEKELFFMMTLQRMANAAERLCDILDSATWEDSNGHRQFRVIDEGRP